jgi:hypothetical protein
MAKFKKCRCNEYIRDENRHLLLTTHHPECSHFNPASELSGVEMQCRHFMNLYYALRDKVSEMQKIIDEDKQIE